MNDITDFGSGKGHTDENFPVASVLIHPANRAPILAFYRFVRAADDVADNAEAASKTKLAALKKMRQALEGEGANPPPEAVALKAELDGRGLSPQHALDLLEAFRRDVGKLRYKDFAELVDYCRYSAMPVGRYVLDVHGESQHLWPANDALCAALDVVQSLCKEQNEARGAHGAPGGSVKPATRRTARASTEGSRRVKPSAICCRPSSVTGSIHPTAPKSMNQSVPCWSTSTFPGCGSAW